MKEYLFLLGVAVVCLFVNFTAMGQEHHQQKKDMHKKDPPIGKANEHMHQSSVDQLVQRFESPERDAYQQPEKVMDFLGNIKGKKIMDIGAGSGYFSIRLAKAGAEVIAADVNDEFQGFLKKRIEKEQLGDLDIELRKLPYDNPSLLEEEVDMVFMVNVYHHIEDRTAYFKKVRLGTEQEGDLVIVDFFKTDLPVGPPTDHKVSIDEIVTELKAAGYQNFEVEVDLLPYQFIVRAK